MALYNVNNDKAVLRSRNEKRGNVGEIWLTLSTPHVNQAKLALCTMQLFLNKMNMYGIV